MYKKLFKIRDLLLGQLVLSKFILQSVYDTLKYPI